MTPRQHHWLSGLAFAVTGLLAGLLTACVQTTPLQPAQSEQVCWDSGTLKSVNDCPAMPLSISIVAKSSTDFKVFGKNAQGQTTWVQAPVRTRIEVLDVQSQTGHTILSMGQDGQSLTPLPEGKLFKVKEVLFLATQQRLAPAGEFTSYVP